MKILSIDYTNMRAHKVLHQTYKVLKDEANERKYHDIEMGLLKSIVKNGDGKSCKTAWPVVQIESTDKGKTSYYFGIVKVFEGRERLRKR